MSVNNTAEAFGGPAKPGVGGGNPMNLQEVSGVGGGNPMDHQRQSVFGGVNLMNRQQVPSIFGGSVTDPSKTSVPNLTGYQWAPLPSGKIIAFYIPVKESDEKIEIRLPAPKKKMVYVTNTEEMRELVVSILARHQKRPQPYIESDSELAKTTKGVRAAIHQFVYEIHHGHAPDGLVRTENMRTVEDFYLKEMSDAFGQKYAKYGINECFEEALRQRDKHPLRSN